MMTKEEKAFRRNQRKEKQQKKLEKEALERAEVKRLKEEADKLYFEELIRKRMILLAKEFGEVLDCPDIEILGYTPRFYSIVKFSIK